MRGMLKDTYIEMLDHKTVYMLGAVTVITILIILASGTLGTNININMGDDVDVNDLNEAFGNPLLRAFSSFMSFLIFLTVMATAGIIPNMLIKGRADYFLSKPMTRPTLFLTKFFSIWVVYGGLIIICSIIVYLFIYFVHGVFQSGVLYLLLLNMLSLFIWLSVISFGGIALGSTGLAIMSAFLMWVIQYLLSFRESINMLIDSKPINYLVDTLYHIFPKTGEISDITLRFALGQRVPDMMPLYSSVIFTVVLLFLTIYIFKQKNY